MTRGVPLNPKFLNKYLKWKKIPFFSFIYNDNKWTNSGGEKVPEALVAMETPGKWNERTWMGDLGDFLAALLLQTSRVNCSEGGQSAFILIRTSCVLCSSKFVEEALARKVTQFHSTECSILVLNLPFLELPERNQGH